MKRIQLSEIHIRHSSFTQSAISLETEDQKRKDAFLLSYLKHDRKYGLD